MAQPWDVVIAGAGPGGCTFGILAARAGLEVLLLDRAVFPRPQIGESLLPENVPLFKRLGVFDALDRGPFLKKRGAVFTHEESGFTRKVRFEDALESKAPYAFQVRRDTFDQLFLERAEQAGVTVEQATTVEEVEFSDDRVATIRVRGQGQQQRSIECGLLVDATGRSLLIGRTLKNVQRDPVLNQSSAYSYFDHLNYAPAGRTGDIEILQTRSAWVWLIPIAEDFVSVGAVWTREQIRESTTKPAQMFERLLEESPLLRARLLQAKRLADITVVADYSYSLDRFIGPNWVCIGDAAAFVDPVFSAGLYLSTLSSEKAFDVALPHLLHGEELPESAQQQYVEWLATGVTRFKKYIYGYYTPEFRKIFYQDPPLSIVRRGVTSILAGNVFEPSRFTRFSTSLFWLAVARQARKLRREARGRVSEASRTS